MTKSREERLRQLVAEWRSWSVGHAGSEEMEAYVRSMRLCADELDAVLREKNPLQEELLDLITLMPDSQTQEIVDYIMSLRDIRKRRDDDSNSSPSGG